MATFYLILFLFITGTSLAQTADITFFTERSFKRASGTLEYAPDKQATEFTPVGNIAPIYLFVEYKDISKITARDRLELRVMKKTSDGEEYAYHHDTYVPKKPGTINIRSNFTEGEYIARLIDKDHEDNIFATATFRVGAATTPDYKHNSTFVACTSVNDDWSPVGETKSIQAGSCIQFLFKASRSLPTITHDFVMWAIRRVNGTEEEYVTDLQQTMGTEPWRFVSTDNVCEFTKPGKYRIYLISKSTLDALHGTVGNDYFGMMELIAK
jgi:hypothetical protein